MNPKLKKEIRKELKIFLNREPTEKEIINSQNDFIIIGRIRDRKIEQLESEINILKGKIK